MSLSGLELLQDVFYDFLSDFDYFFKELSLCSNLKLLVSSRARILLKKVLLSLTQRFIVNILLTSSLILRVPLAVMARIYCSSTGLLMISSLVTSYNPYIPSMVSVLI